MAVRLLLYIPLIAAGLTWGGVSGGEARAVLLQFTSGLLLWTLIEYGLHRFAFHGFAPHDEHHVQPADPRYIVAPLWLSSMSAAVIWTLAALVSRSPAGASVILAGIITGYLAYEALHLLIHAERPGGTLLRRWRKYHYYHHFADERRCYGVTSPLWDKVFGSARQR